MKYLLILCFILGSSLFADKVVSKSVTINQLLYPNKTYVELKEIALQKAKLEAAKEIFGEFLLSETVMLNGQIINDIVKEKSGGVIHIKGEPLYENTKQTGELKVSITAYATDEELSYVSPHVISMKDFTYSNDSIPIKELKMRAEDAFIVAAIATKKPSIKNADVAQARKLALSVKITQFKFDEKTFTYTLSGDVEYIPAFLRHADVISSKSIDKRVVELKNRAYTPEVKQSKKGFYGEWKGFILAKDGSSFSVSIEILDNGEASISYDSLSCGGDLIIVTKRSKRVVFRESLSYGMSTCKESASISLVKQGDSRALFTSFDIEKQERSSGTLYRK